MLSATGKKMGMVIRRSARASITAPPITKIMKMMAMMTKSGTGREVTHSAMLKGIRVTVRNFPKITAPATIMITIQEILRVSVMELTNPCQLNRPLGHADHHGKEGTRGTGLGRREEPEVEPEHDQEKEDEHLHGARKGPDLLTEGRLPRPRGPSPAGRSRRRTPSGSEAGPEGSLRPRPRKRAFRWTGLCRGRSR